MDRQYDEAIRIRLPKSPAKLRQLMEAEAARRGLGLSAWIRLVCCDELRRQGVDLAKLEIFDKND